MNNLIGIYLVCSQDLQLISVIFEYTIVHLSHVQHVRGAT